MIATREPRITRSGIGYALITAPPSRHQYGKRHTFSACAWQELTKFDAAWLICSEPARIIRSTPETQQIRHAAAYIHKLYAVVGEGGDNHTFRAACKLRDAGWSVEESLAVPAEGNETNADPPWSEVELRYKIASAFGRNK